MPATTPPRSQQREFILWALRQQPRVENAELALDTYAAEVWDQGAREHSQGVVNPYYDGKPSTPAP